MGYSVAMLDNLEICHEKSYYLNMDCTYLDGRLCILLIKELLILLISKPAESWDKEGYLSHNESRALLHSTLCPQSSSKSISEF